MLRLRFRLALIGAALGATLSVAAGGARATEPARPALSGPVEPPRGPATSTSPPVFARALSGSFAARRKHEVDELRRRDVAQALADEGIEVRWEEHSLAELLDWRDRIEAARALHDQYATDVDWRAVSLPNLLDMRLRAAKAEELQTVYRIAVDWRGYTWGDLERLRVSLTALHPAMPPADTAPRIAAWDADALAPFDPTRPPERLTTNLHDPDAIIEPRFASEAWSTVSTRAERFGRIDPDAILVPSFEGVPPHVGDGDDLIDPFPASP